MPAPKIDVLEDKTLFSVYRRILGYGTTSILRIENEEAGIWVNNSDDDSEESLKKLPVKERNTNKSTVSRALKKLLKLGLIKLKKERLKKKKRKREHYYFAEERPLANYVAGVFKKTYLKGRETPPASFLQKVDMKEEFEFYDSRKECFLTGPLFQEICYECATTGSVDSFWELTRTITLALTHSTIYRGFLKYASERDVGFWKEVEGFVSQHYKTNKKDFEGLIIFAHDLDDFHPLDFDRVLEEYSKLPELTEESRKKAGIGETEEVALIWPDIPEEMLPERYRSKKPKKPKLKN